MNLKNIVLSTAFLTSAFTPAAGHAAQIDSLRSLWASGPRTEARYDSLFGAYYKGHIMPPFDSTLDANGRVKSPPERNLGPISTYRGSFCRQNEESPWEVDSRSLPPKLPLKWPRIH